MYRHLTLNFLTSIPYSNLNRDDTGVPKRLTQGGVLRAMHSSQSIKRGIRLRYEEASENISVRSGELTELITQRALELNPELTEKKAAKDAANLISQLTKGEAKANSGEATKSSIWLSSEEVETAAVNVAGLNHPDSSEFIQGARTGSLAIAAFGRMFANAPQSNTEAALSVSPAVTTHAAVIENDYFSTADDIKIQERRSGATYLGVSQYTSGVFYRTVSIDKVQLHESWTGFGQETTREHLQSMVRSIVYGQPRGKEKGTAPYTLPALILAEEQRYRAAYDFEEPVHADNHNGGFMAPSIERLAQQYQAARAFDPENFGAVTLLAGADPSIATAIAGLEPTSLQGLIDGTVEWILDV